MTILTIYALFGDDVRLFFSKDIDDFFYGVTSACLFFFTLEIILSIMKKGYFCSFYFWLDTMATLSLISDIGWIWDPIVGNQDFSASNAQQASQLARAGRGARVGTRAGRIIRIIRLVRLIRIVKLYKHASGAITEKKEQENEKQVDQQDESNNETIKSEVPRRHSSQNVVQQVEGWSQNEENKSQNQNSEIQEKESHDSNPLDESDNNQSQDESERNSNQDIERISEIHSKVS